MCEANLLWFILIYIRTYLYGKQTTGFVYHIGVNQAYVYPKPLREVKLHYFHKWCLLTEQKCWQKTEEAIHVSTKIEKQRTKLEKYRSYSQMWFHRGNWGVHLHKVMCSRTNGIECFLLACSLPLLTAQRLIARCLLVVC